MDGDKNNNIKKNKKFILYKIDLLINFNFNKKP